MGSTIYSQKLKHPVSVTFMCEHCGQYNYFSQEIIGNGSVEVSNIRSDKYRQDQIGKIGSKAESDLLRNVQNAKQSLSRGNYSWLKFHKCTKCGYSQSWQTGRLWKRSIIFFIMDLVILYIFFSWLTGSSPESITSGAWGFFAILGIFILIPVIVLVISLLRRDKKNKYKPDVSI
ncbi:MAG TPA: hypothetical protein DD640_01750 [Clostridiales bacterium]|nr:hypothetical protein [Clostridiales bacterium]